MADHDQSDFTGTEIDIRFERSGISKGRPLLEDVAIKTLIHCCAKFGLEKSTISVLFCSKDKIKELNRDFREIDQATDILSFPGEEFESELKPLDSTKQTSKTKRHPMYLGDLAVCMPYVFEDCIKTKTDLNNHYPLLFVHGFLHLIGYDHNNQTREKRMFSLQEKILKELGPHADLSYVTKAKS